MAYDERLAGRIRECVQDLLARDDVGSELTERRMFGGLAFLLGGNMAVSASGTGGLLLRIDPALSDELAGEPHAEPFVMRGRAMDGWLRIAPEGVATPAALERWVAYGVAYASSLPVK